MFGRDIFYLAGYALQMVTASIVTPILTRLLGQASYGRLAASLAIMQVLFTLQGYGLVVGIQRTFSDSGRSAARSVLSLALLASLLSTAAFLISTPLWATSIGFRTLHTALVLTILWAGLSAATAATMSLLRSLERIGSFTIINLVQAVAAQVLGLTLASTSSAKLNAYLTAIVACQAAALLVGLLYTRPRLMLLRHSAILISAAAFSLPVLPQQFAGFILNASDRLVLQRDLGPISVARYQVSYSLAGVAMVVLSLLSGVWLPSLLKLTNRNRLLDAVYRARDALAYLLAPTVVGLAYGVPALLRFWVPPAYHSSGLRVVVLTIALSALPYALFESHYRVLLADKRTGLAAALTIIAALVNLVLNVILVPVLGIDGSAYATLFSYLLLWSLTAIVAKYLSLAPHRSWRLILILAATCLFSTTTLLFPITGLGFVARWLASALCVVLLLLAALHARTQRTMVEVRSQPAPGAAMR